MPSKEIYRDLYSKECGITWDEKKYEVHHLNADHKDNRIENLVLLPFSLHKRLHMYHRMVTSAEFIDSCFTISPLSGLDDFMFASMPLSGRKFFATKAEELEFVKLRDFIRNAGWAKLDIGHDFEAWLKLYSVGLYEKYVKGGK